MTKWIAKINENDEFFGEEILLGIEGGETGFEVVIATVTTPMCSPAIR